MKKLIISGGSDDLIEISGCITDELGAYEGASNRQGEILDLCIGTVPVARVHCFYDGCWWFGFVGTVDEDDGDRVKMPPGWTVEICADGDRDGSIAPYSMSLHITIPDEDDVRVVQRAGKD